MDQRSELGRRGTGLLCLAFSCSGASALVFEVLWFRQASILFGNSVAASALVLSSFMGGLALGSLLSVRLSRRLTSPLRFYAAAEAVIGIFGVGLVLFLPVLNRTFRPVFEALAETPTLLNLFRLLSAFLLLLVPTAAMGTTLPVLVRAASGGDVRFGSALGRLYGWNTLGAVAGSIATEVFLVGTLGIRGSALVAGLLNGIAASIAWALARRSREGRLLQGPAESVDPRPSASTPAVLGWSSVALLAVAALSGALFLALEVLWFRFLLLFVAGSSLAFALMLSVILLGIAIGGLAVSLLRGTGESAKLYLSAVLFASGILLVSAYAGFGSAIERFHGTYLEDPLPVLELGAKLMLPVSVASGAIFTLTGIALKGEGDGTRATGLLTLFNTVGGMTGSLAGAFLLLPRLGVERSFLLVAAAYGAAALLVALLGWRHGTLRTRLAVSGAGLALVLGLLLFPRGLMDGLFVDVVVRRFGRPGEIRVAARREGVLETITYLVQELEGKPVYHRLVTNGHSMSSSNDANRRYMKLFVYLPVALHPQPRKALLVCFGVGDTAKALTGTASLTKIDIVDISRDVLDLSSVVFPESRDNPLHDPRVRVHIEDGRFFLQTTRETYDLITGEPPPPFLAGVVNLYTREYFELLRSRLAPGGFVTYWLPLHGISRRDAFSITRAFCDVFEDCSLWNGDFTNWVLLGSNGAGQPAGDPGRQWADPAVLPSLKALSFESPELLGATFLADAETLREETRDALPVVDEFPKRLSGKPEEGDAAELASLGDTLLASRRFARSAFVGRIFPPPLRERTIDAFRLQFIVVSALKGPQGRTPLAVLRDLDLVLTQTSLETPVLWMLGTDARSVEIARGVEGQGKNDAAVQEILAADDLSRRRYLEAERRYASLKGAGGFVQELRVVLLCLGGERGKAAALARELGALAPRYVFGEEFPRWCESRYGLSPTGS